MIADPAGDSFEKILIAWSIVAPIVAGTAGYFGKRLHIRYQVDQERRSIARDDFIESFTPTIARIQNISDTYSLPYRVIAGILSEDRIVHKNAIAKFEGFLSPKKAIALNEAWVNLSCEDYEERKLPKYYNYLDPVSVKEVKRTVLKNIDALLKFAKYKS